MSTMRYAVYWVPERTHPLWDAGCRWLGRDPEDPARALEPRPHSETPRRYGFHATLKAPMRLIAGVTDEEFTAAIRSIAETTAPFEMPRLEVRCLSDFVALRPTEARNELRLLADRCVVELDRFRAPFTNEEWQQRIVGLDADQRATTSKLGYHYVLHHWRFHMTLSNGIERGDGSGGTVAKIVADAQRHFATALDADLGSGEIALFVEPGPGADFALRKRFPIAR